MGRFIGLELPRKYEFQDDGTLKLTTIPVEGNMAVVELLWKRPEA